MAWIWRSTPALPGLLISSPSTGSVMTLKGANTSRPSEAEFARTRPATRSGARPAMRTETAAPSELPASTRRWMPRASRNCHANRANLSAS
ncbi:hypothetical protein D9M68_839040 [compost metagenome]